MWSLTSLTVFQYVENAVSSGEHFKALYLWHDNFILTHKPFYKRCIYKAGSGHTKSVISKNETPTPFVTGPQVHGDVIREKDINNANVMARPSAWQTTSLLTTKECSDPIL